MKPSLAACHSSGPRMTTLTSRPSRRSARLVASYAASRSGAPTRRTSTSRGAGPLSPAYRAAHDPKMKIRSIPSTGVNSSSTTSGGPNAMRASCASGRKYGLSVFARSSLLRPMDRASTMLAACNRRTSLATVWYGCPVRSARSSTVHSVLGSASTSASSSPCNRDRKTGSSAGASVRTEQVSLYN